MIAPRSIANASSPRPSMNRALVVLLIVCWLVVAAQLPYSLHGAGILAFCRVRVNRQFNQHHNRHAGVCCAGCGPLQHLSVHECRGLRQ